MTPQQQVSSLEPSQRLKELGVKQESLFYWNVDKAFIGDNSMYTVLPKGGRSVQEGYSIDEFSAFTASELGEMLPGFIADEYLYTLQIARNTLSPKEEKKGKWRVVYWCLGDIELHRVDDDSEVNARAKMLIYLLENKLITL